VHILRPVTATEVEHLVEEADDVKEILFRKEVFLTFASVKHAKDAVASLNLAEKTDFGAIKCALLLNSDGFANYLCFGSDLSDQTEGSQVSQPLLL